MQVDLLFSAAEIDALNEIAHEAGANPIDKQGSGNRLCRIIE